MTSHTPGPWSAGGPQWSRSRRTPETQKRAITAPNHPVIANAYGEANARLIAAAPELLEAVVTAAEILEDGHWSNKKAEFRALIAKATGATP